MFAEFSSSRGFRDAISRAGLPAPTIRELGDVHTLRARATETVSTIELAALDALGQAELVRRGDVAPTELVEAAIGRIEALNPTLNAVVTSAFDEAMDAARALPRDPALPFAGVPFLLKDLITECAGMRFTEGSFFLRDNVSTHDQELVVRLRRAGFIILGKTNTPEFGMAPHCEPRLFGPTRNPWNIELSTAGSSGGSAAAVASGMVPAAHGNDLGGSIRYPASCCGLFGLKPTRARVPLGPEYADPCGAMAVEHALTRTVRDSAAILDVIAGPELGDPFPAPTTDRPFADEVGTPPRRLRIAYSARCRRRSRDGSGLRRRARGRSPTVRTAGPHRRRSLAPTHQRAGRRRDRHQLRRRGRLDHLLLDPTPRPGTRSSTSSIR